MFRNVDLSPKERTSNPCLKNVFVRKLSKNRKLKRTFRHNKRSPVLTSSNWKEKMVIFFFLLPRAILLSYIFCNYWKYLTIFIRNSLFHKGKKIFHLVLGLKCNKTKENIFDRVTSLMYLTNATVNPLSGMSIFWLKCGKDLLPRESVNRFILK